MTRFRLLIALAAGITGALAPAASTAATSATPYALVTPPSALEFGCWGPCACPLVIEPTYGSFELRLVGSDPLYTYYDVDRYIASFNNGPGAVSIVGSGHYKIGGEVALTEQMTLDLQVWGGPVQHFDSGLHPVHAAFPEIHVTCTLHDSTCYDSVVVVDAKPIETAGVPGPRRVRGIAGVLPNPFAHSASIVVDLDRAAPVEVTVYDANGREVRRLADPGLQGTAPRIVTWNGRRDDGRESGPGVYWVMMRWPGGTDGRRLVKLE
jgi:hypothetical protein